MTGALTDKKNTYQLTGGRLCFGWFCLFCLVLILKNAQIAMEYIHQGLRLCVKTVIPSLFPFMVISELLVSSGIGAALLRPVSSVFKRLLRLPDAGCCAVLLGILCGFPVGARCAVRALSTGELNREEAERVLLFSTNPSSAFLINAVGGSLWGNQKFGVLLYLSTLLSQFIVGLCFTHLPKRKETDRHSAVDFKSHIQEPTSVGKFFTDAVASSANAILLVCAYVIFFSALGGTVNLALEHFCTPACLKAIIFGFLELSGGMSAAAALPSTPASALLCAFAAGWCGISVHCQLLSVCSGSGIRLRTYLLAKPAQGILCALIFGVLLCIFPAAMVPGVLC